MKTLLLILFTAGATFASVYLIVSNQQASRAKLQLVAAQANWDKEKMALETALASAQSQPVQRTIAAAPAAQEQNIRLTPEQIIEKLVTIHSSGAERNRNLRLIVYYLESLAEWNTAALPAIDDFLARNEDVDYTVDEAALDAADQNTGPGGPGGRNNRGGPGGRGGNDLWQFRRGGEMRTDFVFPPSLRLGLVDVLKAIGGEEAEKVLASTLESTGRGLEVAYISRILEQMAPGKYRELAVNVAKDLLMHPLESNSGSRLDNNSKSYLFGVLSSYNDGSFAEFAKAMLVGEDGRIDRTALNYINSTLKELAVPTLYDAYNNPSLTNFWEKARLGESILNYVGNNQTANQLLTDIVNNGDLDDRMKMMTIIRLAGGGFGPFQTESPSDSVLIQSRIGVIQGILRQPNLNDQVAVAANRTLENLQTLASGGTIDQGSMMRDLFGGWGRGNRGNRGPGGN